MTDPSDLVGPSMVGVDGAPRNVLPHRGPVAAPVRVQGCGRATARRHSTLRFRRVAEVRLANKLGADRKDRAAGNENFACRQRTFPAGGEGYRRGEIFAYENRLEDPAVDVVPVGYRRWGARAWPAWSVPVPPVPGLSWGRCPL
jgi:hypothetical protein